MGSDANRFEKGSSGRDRTAPTDDVGQRAVGLHPGLQQIAGFGGRRQEVVDDDKRPPDEARGISHISGVKAPTAFT